MEGEALERRLREPDFRPDPAAREVAFDGLQRPPVRVERIVACVADEGGREGREPHLRNSRSISSSSLGAKCSSNSRTRLNWYSPLTLSRDVRRRATSARAIRRAKLKLERTACSSDPVRIASAPDPNTRGSRNVPTMRYSLNPYGPWAGAPLRMSAVEGSRARRLTREYRLAERFLPHRFRRPTRRTRAAPARTVPPRPAWSGRRRVPPSRPPPHPMVVGGASSTLTRTSRSGSDPCRSSVMRTRRNSRARSAAAAFQQVGVPERVPGRSRSSREIVELLVRRVADDEHVVHADQRPLGDREDDGDGRPVRRDAGTRSTCALWYPRVQVQQLKVVAIGRNLVLVERTPGAEVVTARRSPPPRSRGPRTARCR